jgi:hypothetical protein
VAVALTPLLGMGACARGGLRSACITGSAEAHLLADGSSAALRSSATQSIGSADVALDASCTSVVIACGAGVVVVVCVTLVCTREALVWPC